MDIYNDLCMDIYGYMEIYDLLCYIFHIIQRDTGNLRTASLKIKCP